MVSFQEKEGYHMRYQRLKIMAAVCLLMVSGCCGCSRNCSGPDSGELLVTAAGSENQEIFRASEDGEPSLGQSGTGSTYGDDSNTANPNDGSPVGGDAEGTQETEPPCYVHICGEVVSPGVYELEAGSRIFQAVEAAGGFTENAAAEYLNMAELVGDGMKIVVPDIRVLDEASVCGTAAGGAAAVGITDGGSFEGRSLNNGKPVDQGAGTEKQKVNINTAPKEELMTLKGIGESKAEDIIAYRESHGGFSKIEDIMKISGIKNAAFDKIKDDITV